MWNSIRTNEGVAASMGIDLKAYAMTDSAGYPPCGVPLMPDSSVNMKIMMGNSTGIDDPNPHLYMQWGAVWADWNEEGPFTVNGVLGMKPPHQQDVFYTW